MIIFSLGVQYIASNFNNFNDNYSIDSDSVEFISFKNIPNYSYNNIHNYSHNYSHNRSNDFPNMHLSNKLNKVEGYDYEVYTLSNSTNYDKIILYIHGGAYFSPINKQSVKLCDGLATRTNSKVYIPLYGLGYDSTYKDAYPFLTELYKDLLKENKTIIIMGDSAGGGLALGFCEYLKESHIKLPDKQILICPWVDITLSNKFANIFNSLNIDSNALIKKGNIWAGDLNKSDYKVSPINGNLSNLPETLLFASTGELIFPDLVKLYIKMSVNSTVHFVIAEKAVHNYPLHYTGATIIAYNKMIVFING